jgi:hypothetical protein
MQREESQCNPTVWRKDEKRRREREGEGEREHAHDRLRSSRTTNRMNHHTAPHTEKERVIQSAEYTATKLTHDIHSPNAKRRERRQRQRVRSRANSPIWLVTCTIVLRTCGPLLRPLIRGDRSYRRRARRDSTHKAHPRTRRWRTARPNARSNAMYEPHLTGSKQHSTAQHTAHTDTNTDMNTGEW